MEDIEDEFVALEHNRLVNAISQLDKTHYITLPKRREPTYFNTEFNSIKIDTNTDAKSSSNILGNTAHHVEIGKNLEKSTDESKVLPKPLEKLQVERIKRVTGYEETKKIVGRWDPVVARNRTLDYVSFPIKHVENRLQPTEEFIKRFELKSELEKELEEIEPSPQVEEEDEEDQIYPMSYEEMLEHRRHMAKLRAQQSYKAAKAKRQSKIKSKKYHRILKKEKLKQQLKEFEELQKTNPEEALKKLESLEKARALERHTLRHKNTGKWAKSQTIRAKYDKEVRQQLAEQLAVSRGLTQKTQNDSTDESEDNENIPDISLSQDPMNPWVMKTSNADAEFEFGYKKYIKGKMFKRKESDSESDQDDLTQTGNDSLMNKKLNTLVKSIENIHDENDQNKLTNVNNEHNNQQHKEKFATSKAYKKLKSKKSTPVNNRISKPKVKAIIATSNWTVEISKNHIKPRKDISSAFASLENKISIKVEKKLKQLRKNIEKLESSSLPKVAKRDEQDTLKYLQFNNKKLKPIIDEELIESVHKNKNIEEPQNNKNPMLVISEANKLSKEPIQSTSNAKLDLDIDFTKFVEFKPKHLNTSLPRDEIGLDDLDDDEQVVPKLNIEEVFEEEDVVASFRQEKEDEINKNKAQDIDCILPGWGTWGGKGVKAPKRKRNRFILKGAEVTPRRDENKGDVIITEYKDPKLASHKLTDVPFPFESIKEYEASIRAPISNTFIPEKAHKKLIKPNVITRAGTIIEPMDEDELLIKRNRTFRNKDVIKILAKK